jgi:DNA (cytosine-5)-methyltransferase 1
MRFLSVCSGIEAASVAWKPLGWTCAGVSEIEPFPRAVLEHRQGVVPCDWDHRHSAQSNLTPLFGDFTQIESHHVGPIDLLVGGTPCQSFSIAGLRGGLADDRGNLALEFLRLADRTRPRWLVWENVPGVLSSNGGRDFGAILGGMVELGYGFAYRVLDAQFFGVPQRRRRVFVVGHLGSWQRAAAVLFERYSLSGHPAPRREKGKGFAAELAPSLTASGRGVERTGESRGQDPVVAVNDWPAEVAPTLNAAFGTKLGLEDQHIRGGADGSFLPAVAMCLNAGAMGRRDAETETLIPTTGAVFDVVDVAPTLRAGGNATGGTRPYGTDVDTCDSLIPVPFDTTQITSAANYSNPKPGDACHPLAAGAHPPAIAFPAELSGTQSASSENLCPSLSVKHTTAVAYAIQERAVSENLENGPQGKGFQEGVAYTLEARNKVQATAFALRGRAGGAMPEVEGDQVGALRAASGGSSRSYVATSAVRRLTPRECERLQGFPDDYTQIPWRKKYADECPDGPRYKALGNSMAVPVMAWIGQRIQQVENLISAQEAA